MAVRRQSGGEAEGGTWWNRKEREEQGRNGTWSVKPGTRIRLDSLTLRFSKLCHSPSPTKHVLRHRHGLRRSRRNRAHIIRPPPHPCKSPRGA